MFLHVFGLSQPKLLHRPNDPDAEPRIGERFQTRPQLTAQCFVDEFQHDEV